MKEKILSVVLAFALVLGSVPMTSFVSANSTGEPDVVTESTGELSDTEISTPSVTEDDTGKTNDDTGEPEKSDNDPDKTDVSTDTEETDSIKTIYNQLKFKNKTYDGNTDVSLDGNTDDLIKAIKEYLNAKDSKNEIDISEVSFKFENENVSYYNYEEGDEIYYKCGNKIVKTTIILKAPLSETQKEELKKDSENNSQGIYSVDVEDNENKIVITKKSAAKIIPIVISCEVDKEGENYNKVYDGTTAIHNGKVRVKINKGDEQLEEEIIDLSETNELALNKTVDNDGNEIIIDKIRVKFANADAGENKDITLSLINTDELGKPTKLANYSFSSDKKEKTATVNTNAKIDPLTVTINPQEIYYGQKTPGFTFTKNVDDDKLSSTLEDYLSHLTVKIKDGKFVEGTDYLALGEYTLTAENTNPNIEISESKLNVIQNTESPDATVKFKLEKDGELQDCAKQEDGSYKYYYVDEIYLCAPEGYYINTTNDLSNFGKNESIEVEVEETDDGKITYYLRQSDGGAISEAKTFKYSCVKTKPTFVEATVEKVNDDKELFYFKQYGIFTNDTEIKITVTISGGSVYDDKLSMALQSNTKAVEPNENNYEINNDVYYYTATWIFNNSNYEGALGDISVIVSSQIPSGETENGNITVGNFTIDNFTIDNNTDSKEIYFDYTSVKIDITKANAVDIDGVDWYNIASRDKKETITFDFSDIIKDENGNVIDIPVSGIREIKITDNTNTVLYKESFESNIVKSTSWSKALSEFSEGEHEIVVTATDNAGNESKETYIFYVDYTPVKIERDTTKANAVDIDDVDWYNIASKDNNEILKFDFSDIIKDEDGNVIDISVSGIREIKIIDNTNTVLYKESFESNIVKSTSWSRALSEFSEGEHKIVVTATDNVGNKSEETYIFYVDYTPVSIKSDITKAEGETAGYILIGDKKWYNKDNQNAEIKLSFEDAKKDEDGNVIDISVSGIQKIEITDNGENIYDNKESTWSKALSEFSEGEHEIVVTATDSAGNESKETYIFYVDYTPVKIERDTTKANAVVVDKVDWYNIASKDKNEAITFDFSDTKKDEDGNIINISVSDIQKIEITDNGENIYDNKESTWSKALSEFSEGKHEIVVTATDNVGNKSEETYAFYVDYTSPTFGEDTIEVIKSDGTKGKIVEIKDETDNSQWFSGDEYIKLKIPVNDENKNANGQEDIIDNAVKYVKVTIQGSETKIFEFSSLDGNSTIEVENGQQYVVVTTNGLSPDMEHKYTIKAEIKDLADNTCNSFERIYYQDFSVPEITKVVVSKVEPSFGVLNLLPFGAYANTKLKSTISTKDEMFDSGIAYISVTYTDVNNQLQTEEISEFINNTETGTCDFVFPLNGKISESNIDIIVYDKYGKKSPICSNFENSGNTFVMIEENKPNLDIVLSENDGVKTTDDKIWYKGTDGTDKEITIKVQDEESGLRDMKVTVTSATANQTITLTKDSNNKTFLTAESTSEKAERDTQEYIFTLSKNALLKNKSFNGADGQYTVKVEVWDNSGNKSTVSKNFYIDKTLPEIDSITFSAAENSTVINSTNISDYIEMLDYGYYFKADLIATVKVSDEQASSGLKSVSYQLIGADKKIVANNSVNIINGKATFSIPKDFKGEVKVNVFDNVHNETGDKSPDALVIDTPSKHGEETHITISNPGETPYKDANGNNLYTRDVSLTVTLKDTVSGLSEISYSTSAEKGSVATQKVVIENNGNYKKGDKIGGWTVTKTERNLVTEVTRTFTYTSDDNDIIMKFNIIDRAGNTTSLSSAKFTVDKTAPVISVSFNEPTGNNEYYREVRTAEITVTERNFDMNRISAEIKNAFGAVPSVNFTKKSNTQYVANVTFKEGDYTFSINGTDRGNHTAKVNYLGKNTSKFYVDLTDPTETDNFNSFKNDKNNSFSTPQTMTFSITEHNFNKDLVNIKVYAANAGQDLNSNTRKLVETSLVWNSNGDIHTTQISFNNDAVYQVEIEVKDLSGRLLSKKTSAVFEIDKTKPSLSKDSAQNGVAMIATNKENLAEFKDIIFEDANINKIVYTVNIYQKVENAEQGYSISCHNEEKEKQSSGVISFAEDIQNIVDLKDDSIYEVIAKAYDDTGNVSDNFICTYVIFEHSTFMAYVSNSDTGKYIFDGESKRSKDINDIEVVLYAMKDTKYKVEVGDEEWTEDDGFKVTVDENKNINQIQCFNITILASKFREKYSNIDTDRALNLTIGTDEETLSLGQVVIDNVEPIGKFDTSLLNLSWYDGFYNTDAYEVKLISLDSRIDETKVLITDNGKQVKDFHYDENEHVIKFTVNAGEHRVKVVLYDTAGNEKTLDEITFYVGSFWGRWWPMLVIGIGVILVVAGIITFLIIKKRKNSV